VKAPVAKALVAKAIGAKGTKWKRIAVDEAIDAPVGEPVPPKELVQRAKRQRGAPVAKPTKVLR
jgi:Arc/MetJ family transcription regulator